VDTLLASMTFVQILILLAVLASFLIIILVVLFKLLGNRKVSLKTSLGQISSEQGNSSNDPSVNSMVIGVFTWTLETVSMMVEIKTKMILHDQMTYLEERLVLIKNSILESYRMKMKDSYEKGTQVSSQEYLFYKSLVELMKEDMKSNIRMLFLRNHFSTFTEPELQAYIQEKNMWIMTSAIEFLRIMYPSEKMTIQFFSVEESFNDVRKTLEDYMNTVFRQAAKIYNDRNKQIDSLGESLHSKVNSTYGVDLYNGGMLNYSSIIKGKEATYDKR